MIINPMPVATRIVPPFMSSRCLISFPLLALFFSRILLAHEIDHSLSDSAGCSASFLRNANRSRVRRSAARASIQWVAIRKLKTRYWRLREKRRLRFHSSSPP